MRKKTLAIVAATALVLAGGWALAQSRSHGLGGFGPQFMMRSMGPGMMRHMQGGPNSGMGPVRMGPGMMAMNHDATTMAQLGNVHSLLVNHDRVTRTVTNLPDGIRTVTESDDPEIASLIKKHVAEMGQRVQAGDDPGLPIESPALRAIFRNSDKIKTTYQTTEKGVAVVQTSGDQKTVAALQTHAGEVTDLVKGGMAALHASMMRNNGGMMGMMFGSAMRGEPGSHMAPNAKAH